MDINTLLTNPKSITRLKSTKTNSIYCARRRAEQTSKLVGAATQFSRLRKPSDVELAKVKYLTDIHAVPFTEEVFALSPSPRRSPVASPGPSRSSHNATSPSDGTLLLDPPSSCVERGKILPGMTPIGGSRYDEERNQHGHVSGTGTGLSKPTDFRVELEPEHAQWRRSLPAVRGDQDSAISWTPSTSTGYLLPELEGDAELLAQNLDACLAALDRLTGARTAAVPPQRDLPPALLLALRHHCRIGQNNSNISLQHLLHVSRQLVRLRPRSQEPSAGSVKLAFQGPASVEMPLTKPANRRTNSIAPTAPGLHALVDQLAVSTACRLEAAEEGKQGIELLPSAAGGCDAIRNSVGHFDGRGGEANIAVAARCAAAILHNLVKLGGSGGGGGMQRLVEAVAATRRTLVPSLDSRSLQDLVWALGKLGASIQSLPPARQLLVTLMARLAEPGLLDCMSTVGLSMVVYGMGKIGLPYADMHVRRAVGGAVAAAASASGPPGCEPQALANMAWGLSRMASASAAAVTAMASRGAAPSLQPLQPQTVCHTQGPSSSICHSNASDLAACVQLAGAAMRQLDRFKPRELANLLGALAALGAFTDPRITPLLDACRTYARLRLRELGPHDVAELLYAYAIASTAMVPVLPRGSSRPLATSSAAVREPQLLRLPRQQIGAAMNTGANTTPVAAGIVNASEPLHDSELWALLERRCMEVLPHCPTYQLATMLWAFTHLGHRPAGLLSAVVSALPFRPYGDDHTDAQPGLIRGNRKVAELPPLYEAPAQQHGSVSTANETAAHISGNNGLQVPLGRSHHHQQQQRRKRGHQKQNMQHGQQAPQSGLAVEMQREDACQRLVLDLESLPPMQMSQLVWALAKLDARVSHQGLRRLCAALHGQITHFDTKSLLVTIWGLATLGCPGNATLEPVVGCLTTLLPSLDTEQLPMALWSIAKLMTTAGGKSLPSMAVLRFFQASRGPLTAALPRLTSQGVAMVAWAYATAGINLGDAAMTRLWERAVEVAKAAAAQEGRDTGQALAMVAGAMAEFRCRHERLTRAVLVAADVHMAAALQPISPPPPANHTPWSIDVPHGGKRLNEQASVSEGVWLSSMACSLGRLGVNDARFLDLACRRARVLAPMLSPREAIPLLWGLGVIARRAISEAPGIDEKYDVDRDRCNSDFRDGRGVPQDVIAGLAKVIERAIVASAQMPPTSSHRTPRRGGATSAATANSDCGSGAGLRAALDGGLLSMFLIACVSHRHRPAAAVLEATSVLLRRRLRSLASHTLCEIAWALAVLRLPTGGNIGVHAMLPLIPGSELLASASTTAGMATATVGLYPVPPSQSAGQRAASGFYRDSKARPSSLAENRDEAKGHVAKKPPPSHADANSSRRSKIAGAAASIDSEPTATTKRVDRQADCNGSSGGGAGGNAEGGSDCIAKQRLPWSLRWTRPEAPLVLAMLQLRRRWRWRRLLPGPRSSRDSRAPLAQPRPGGAAMPATCTAQTSASSCASRRGDPRDGDADMILECRKRTGTQPVGARLVALPTPRASDVAPIYPPRHAVPTDQVRSQQLLASCLRLLGRRLCVERSEVLTLESLVKVSWAMCVLRMYTPRLFRYCAARALCCSTAPLENRPLLLRALVQVRALVARQRPSAWRRLRLRVRWRHRQKAGATWNVLPATLLAQTQPALARRLQRCRASLDAAAEAAGLLLEWRNTYEGDRHGVLRLGSRSACALLVVPPWEEEGGHHRQQQGMDAVVPSPPLGDTAVAARLLLLRGWLVACVRVERWLSLEPAEQRQQLAALHAQMRSAARAQIPATVTN
ncbi:hypothetical protein Vafri_10646 [Volvox africanus]|uniref:RAP domain-containing protein n=1 Tax=Volvox africanus TaxID=51714 RepID=A0A8J4F0L5_9CHLO|nr:hypothetical protein Vafri_10646 [Volvox africanus]